MRSPRSGRDARECRRRARLVTKVGLGARGVFWDDGRVRDRGPRAAQLASRWHQGTVGRGSSPCHWHHARFDLVSGSRSTCGPTNAAVRRVGTPSGGDVFVEPGPRRSDRHLQTRLRNGSRGDHVGRRQVVLGLLDAGVSPATSCGRGRRLRQPRRGAGWGAGLTVLVAMANLFRT